MSSIGNEKPTDNKNYPEEKELNPTPVGVVAVIIDMTTGKVLVIQEKCDKTSTGKKSSMISFPAETRKVGESESDNLTAALMEAFSDQDLPFLKNNLFLSGHSPYSFFLDGDHSLPVDIAILIYNGQEFSPHPTQDNEVEIYGWVAIEELQGLFVRHLTLDVLAQLKEGDLINKARENFQQGGKVFPLPPSFSFKEFHRQRELRTDVVIGHSLLYYLNKNSRR